MKQLLLVLIITLMNFSCAPGRRNWSSDKVQHKIEKGVKKGMRYNHNCVNREKDLKLKTIE